MTRSEPSVVTLAGRPRQVARPPSTVLFVAVLAWALMSQLDAQDGAVRFSSQVRAVEVYATVTDMAGEPVSGLKADDFQLEDEGRVQRVSTFAEGAFPLTVALGVDRSWSMAGEPLRRAKLASRSFLRQLNDEDRSMVVAIGAEAEVVAPLGRDRDAQADAIAGLDPWSSTSLRDAVVNTLDRLEPESGRQALVMFSDGIDRYSRASAADVTARVRRSGALIYPIVIGKAASPLMSEVAALTGGRSFVLRDTRDLEATLATVARELRHQYLLGYVPFDAGEGPTGGWHSIRVRVREQETRRLRVRARDGYWSGGEASLEPH